MCIYGKHMYICILNMKFLCLTLWQEEVCTDDDDANDDAQSMYKALWLINQMSQKLFSFNIAMIALKTK